jgi:hypothetical protein
MHTKALARTKPVKSEATGPVITSNTPGLSEYKPHKFSVEASDIGLRPGEWPRTLTTTLGNGLVLIAQRREVSDGNLLWVDYLQSYGYVWLHIYND